MTKALEHAFAQAAKLPEKEQEALAAVLLEELASEKRWAEQFAASQEKVAALADEALEEYRAGKTRPFDSDRDLTHD
jgi:hypothetical protein